MTVLTHDQKITICKTAINILKRDVKYGLCFALKYSLFNIMDVSGPILNLFPEVLVYKPSECVSLYWFPSNEIGQQKRIEILESVIIELTNK